MPIINDDVPLLLALANIGINGIFYKNLDVEPLNRNRGDPFASIWFDEHSFLLWNAFISCLPQETEL